MRWLWIAVWSFTFLSVVSGQALTPQERFAGVKRWKFVYSYHASSPFTWEENGYTHNRHTWVHSESGTIDLITESLQDGKMKLSGRGAVSASTNLGKTITGPGEYIETRYDRGSGTPVTNVSILLEFDLGTYDLDINSGEFSAKYGGSKNWSTEDSKYGPEDETIHVNPPWPAPAEKKLIFPESGRVLAGNWSWQDRWKKEPEFRDGFNLAERARVDHTSGSVRWMLIPDDALDVELILEPQSYAEWMPQGGTDEKTAGNTIAIKATLVDKKTGGAPSVTAS